MRIILIFLFLVNANAVDNGLGRTPVMGWLSWQRFRCNIDCTNDPNNCISENLYKQMADHLASDGYKEVGYDHVNIDDCWSSKERDSEGRLVADPVRFPSGIANLANYVHSKGLKLGIYGDFGSLTCGGYPGSKFYLDTDAQTFADWGIDMLKLDGCYSTTDDFAIGYPTMEFFLNKTGRPILYSCSWPAYIVGAGKIPDYKAIANSCNIWRNYEDITDSWDSLSGIIEFYGKDSGNFSLVAGPGNFNDPDMLIIGNFGLSYDQERVQMALWAIMASPLLMSNDLRAIRAESKEILLNPRLIKINQDPQGIQGKRVFKSGNIEIWTRPILPEGTYAFAVLNLGSGGDPATVTTELASIGLTNPGGYNVTDAFTGVPMGTYGPQSPFVVKPNPSGVVMAVAKPM